MIATTIHAPSSNLPMPTTIATTPVAKAPSALIAALTSQPRDRRRSQRRTMPVCDSVKAMNTPTV